MSGLTLSHSQQSLDDRTDCQLRDQDIEKAFRSHFSSAAEASLNLVTDEENVVLLAKSSNLGEVAVVRNQNAGRERGQ